MQATCMSTCRLALLSSCCILGLLLLLVDFGAVHPFTVRSRNLNRMASNAQLAALDDVLGTRQHWLAHHMPDNSSQVHVATATQTQLKQNQRADNQPSIICRDTCYKAHDGICDEGRGGNLSLSPPTASWVFCDLGTDCHDCGPWQGVPHGLSWSEPVGPVHYAQLHGHQSLLLQQVPYQPAFLFAYAHPDLDSELSAKFNSSKVIEPGITQVSRTGGALAASQVFVAALTKHCDPTLPGDQTGLVVDVGANFGWYTLMAAALGCRAVAIEPVPLFRAFLEFAAARNHLTPWIEVLPAVVAADTSKLHRLTVPLQGPLGTAGLHDNFHQQPHVMQIPARAVRLDDLAFGAVNTTSISISSSDQSSISRSSSASSLHESNNSSRRGKNAGSKMSSRFLQDHQQRQIQVLKVDVEGREPEVLGTAQQLLASGRVQNIFLEYSPGYYYDRLSEIHRLPTMLLDLIRFHYRLLHIPWHVVYDQTAVAAAGGWNSSSMPEMDLVSPEQLKYDLWTAGKLRNGTLPGMHGPASWPCQAMAAARVAFAEVHQQGLALHVLAHPKSFASLFVFNTNIWASLGGQLQPKGQDTLLNPDMFPGWYDSAGSWFPQGAITTEQECGLPWALCNAIPPAFQVAHRCRCTDWDVCGEQQVAVQTCMQQRLSGYEDLNYEQIEVQM